MSNVFIRLSAVFILMAWAPPGQSQAEPSTFPVVHRVDGGAGELFANAYVIEGRSGVIVVDGLLSRQASIALRERARRFRKPVLAVVVTHGHPDHYGGVAQVVAGSSAVPVMATPGVDTIIRRDDALRGDRLAAAGFDWAEKRTFPNVLVRDGVEITLGDLALTPVDVGPAESHHDSIWMLHSPDGMHAFVGDLVMNGVHAYTADAHTGRWLDSLRRYQTMLEDAVRVYPGHGEPGSADESLSAQARYLERFRAEVLDLAQGHPALSAEQASELERRMIRFVGHDRVSRWVIEGASPVARELADDTGSGR